MSGKRSVRRSPSTQDCPDNPNDHDSTPKGPTKSGRLRSNRWYLCNSVGSSSAISTDSSSPMSSSSQGQETGGNSLVRGQLMFSREVITRESSSTTTSLGLNTNECAQMNTLRNISNIPCCIAVTICCLPGYLLRACVCAKNHITMENFIKFFSVAILIFFAVYCSCVCRRSSDVLSLPELTQRYQTELKSVWQSHLRLEKQIHDAEALKMVVDHLHDHISGINKNISHSIKQILEESDIPGENKEQVVKMINLAIKKIYEDHVQMADWAQKTLGATIDKERTSESYKTESMNICWFFCSAKPPETVLEPDVHPGNCWAFRGSEGHVVIKLPEKIYPLAVTVQHVAQAITPSESIVAALKDFVVSGLDDGTGEETLLGIFMYDIDKEPIQTFQLQNQHSKQFLYIKFKILSNWGNQEFTCIYRLRVHGNIANLLGPLDEGSE